MKKLERNVIPTVELPAQAEECILDYFIKHGHISADKASSITPNTQGNVPDNARRLYLRTLLRTDRRQQKEVTADRLLKKADEKERKRQEFLAKEMTITDENLSRDRIRVEVLSIESGRSVVMVVQRDISYEELLSLIRGKLRLPKRYNTLLDVETGGPLNDLLTYFASVVGSARVRIATNAPPEAMVVEQTPRSDSEEEVIASDNSDEDDSETEETSSIVLHLPPLSISHDNVKDTAVVADVEVIHDTESEASEILDCAAEDVEEEKDPMDMETEVISAASSLPIESARNDILSAVARHQCVVIVGETGSGKTTQIPQYLLSQPLTTSTVPKPLIIVTQPRRLAAVSVAQRVALELGCAIGTRVGYHVRHQHSFDECKSAATEILFVTTGILLRYLQDASSLSRISHLIIDEVHERQVETDLVLTLLRHKLHSCPHLKLLVLSATMDSAAMSIYLDNCPVITVPGRSFPVDQKYIDDAMILVERFAPSSKFNLAFYPKNASPSRTVAAAEDFDASFLSAFLVSLMKYCDSTAQCDYAQSLNVILVFLPGLKTIQDTAQCLRHMCKQQIQEQVVQICMLHSSFPLSTQRAIYRPPPSDTCKHRIVLSTNIAESSLTVPGVVHVVDTGFVRQMDFDPSIDTSTLHTTAASLASLKQRAGRAGRTQPGVCWRLFSEASLSMIPAYTPPEMRRVPLEDVVLKILMLGFGEFGDCPHAFLGSCPEPPSHQQIDQAILRLLQMQAIFPTSASPSPQQQRYGLTQLGFTLAQLPLDARLGYFLILGCVLRRIEPILTIAAVLADQSPLLSPIGRHAQASSAHKQLLHQFYSRFNVPIEDRVASDHVMTLAAYTMWELDEGPTTEFCRCNYLSLSILLEMKKLRRLYHGHLLRYKLIPDDSQTDTIVIDSVFRYVLCAGLYPRIARLNRGPAAQPKPPKHARGKGKSKMPVKLATVFLDKHSSNLSFHPCSALSGRVKELLDGAKAVGDVKNMYFAYFRKVASPPCAVQIYDATEVSPTMLLLCGHSMSYDRKSRAKSRAMLDNWIEIKVNEASAVLLRALQREILELFRLMLVEHDSCTLADRRFALLDVLKYILQAKQVNTL